MAAARQDASLGEISFALEQAFGRYETTRVPLPGVYSEAYADDKRFTQVVAGVESVARRLGDHQDY